jgi:hypothetical protein
MKANSQTLSLAGGNVPSVGKSDMVRSRVNLFSGKWVSNADVQSTSFVEEEETSLSERDQRYRTMRCIHILLPPTSRSKGNAAFIPSPTPTHAHPHALSFGPASSIGTSV